MFGFKNKTKMKAAIKAILNKQTMTEEDRKLIMDVASIYQNGNVVSVSRQKDSYGNNQFKTNIGVFSYGRAVDYLYGKHETPAQAFSGAARRFLVPYHLRIKQDRLPSICRHTRLELFPHNTHLDHVGELEFADIVRVYLKHNSPTAIPLKNTDNGSIFANVTDGLRFKRFHDVLCLLDPVHKTHNLKRG